MTDSSKIAFTLHLWGSADENGEFPGDVAAMATHFKTYVLSALEKNHFGRCTDIDISCDRCYVEGLMTAADKLSKIYDSASADALVSEEIEKFSQF